jgi:hypothetical protein
MSLLSKDLIFMKSLLGAKSFLTNMTLPWFGKAERLIT